MGSLTFFIETETPAAPASRGVFGGGTYSAVQTDTICYITISSVGDALDFGNLSATNHINLLFHFHSIDCFIFEEFQSGSMIKQSH